MRYKIEWLEVKNKDWKVATLKLPTGETFESVSINRVGKKGDIFPNFDLITLGGEVTGEYWQSSNNKNYLFPPKEPKSSPRGGFGASKGIEMAQNRKAGFIEKAQDNKELGIKISSTMRMAVDLAIANLGEGHLAPEFKEAISFYRNWLWAEWENYPKGPVDIDEAPQI